MSAKLIYTPDNFTNLVNQTIDFNANQSLTSHVVAFAAYTTHDDSIRNDAITMLQSLYYSTNTSAFDDFYHRYFLRDRNVFISKELAEGTAWSSTVYSVLLNDGLILSASAEQFVREARMVREEGATYQYIREAIKQNLDNWNSISYRRYDVSDESRLGVVPSGEKHSDALAMFFAGMAWSIKQIQLENSHKLAALCENNNGYEKMLLFEDNRLNFYLATAKYVDNFGYSGSTHIGRYNVDTHNVAGQSEIPNFDELYRSNVSLRNEDQLTYEGYVVEHLTRNNGQFYLKVFENRNYLRAFVQVQDLTVVGEFFEREDFNKDTHILLSNFGPRYTITSVRNYSMPLSDVPSTAHLVKETIGGTYMLRPYAIVVKDNDADQVFVMNRRNDSDIESAGFYRCDCGSQTYVYEPDEFSDRLSVLNPELCKFIDENYANPYEIYDGLLHYVRDCYDEEGPSDDYYCSDCGMGEYEDDDEYNNGYFDGISDSQISSLETALASSNKKMCKTTMNFNTVYYVVDADKENTTKESVLYDYTVHDYDYDPYMEFVKKDEANPLFLGMEWEMDFAGKSHTNSILINSALSKNKSYSYTMSDGSLESGIEIATMPATLQAHMSDFDYDTACKIASALGYRGHDTSTAGIHVHMSRSFFGKDRKIQNYKGALLALILERNWEDFVKFSRRRYSRLDQWAKKKDYLQKLPTNPTPDDYESTFRTTYDYDKYVALNTRKTETFELRIFRSTLKPETIKATLQLVHNFATWVKDNDLAAAQQVSFEDIVNYIPHKELTEYWQVAKEREVRD